MLCAELIKHNMRIHQAKEGDTLIVKTAIELVKTVNVPVVVVPSLSETHF